MGKLTHDEIHNIAIKYLDLRKKAEETENDDDIKEFQTYQNYCAVRLKPLVLAHVYKYKKFSNYPDLEQDGFEALLMSLNTFKPARGHFGYWAKQYIKTKVCRAANAHSTIRIPIKKAKEMRPYKTNSIPVQTDARPNPFETLETSEIEGQLIEVIGGLPVEQKEIIDLTYGFNGSSQNTAGKVMEQLSLSRQQYTKLLNVAKNNIKKQFIKLEK